MSSLKCVEPLTGVAPVTSGGSVYYFRLAEDWQLACIVENIGLHDCDVLWLIKLNRPVKSLLLTGEIDIQRRHSHFYY